MNIFFVSLLILLTSPSASLPVDLGSSSCFAILSKQGVYNYGVSLILGNVGTTLATDPFDCFGTDIALDWDEESSSSPLLEGGRMYGASHSAPTPDILEAAIGHMDSAFFAASQLYPEFSFSGDHDFEEDYFMRVGVTHSLP